MKQIEEWSGMSKTTLWRKLEILEEKSRISRVSDMKQVDIPTERYITGLTSWKNAKEFHVCKILQTWIYQLKQAL